jgi:hypothetical protein
VPVSRLDEPLGVPAYFTVPMAAPRRQPVPDRASGVWASLQLAGEAMAPLHTGSGVPEPVGHALVAGIPVSPAATAQPPRPVLPGAGVKGALRAVFEAVTYACDPLEDRCRSMQDACPACALFGMAGLRGALAVSELSVAGDTSVLHVPQRYSHADAPRRGRRLYGLAPETGTAEAEEALLVIQAGARLTGTLTLSGAEPWAMGALALVAGLVPDGLPLLRLGGGKNRGLGVARLQPTTGSYALSQRAWLLGERRDLTVEVLSEWARAADANGDLRGDQLQRIGEAYSRDG